MASTWRQGEKGVRPVRIANCSGYHGDDADEMYKQVTRGDVDFVTGDYLAEVNIANNAEAFARGEHPGYEETAWDGLQQSIDVINQKRIKVAINGGALNPKGLAEKTAESIESKGYSLRVAYVSGDNLLDRVGSTMPFSKEDALPHLDSLNKHVHQTSETYLFARDPSNPPKIVSANAYLGARAIVKAFEEGADIVISGRASDASPIIAAAWYWWGWSDANYDAIAGGLVAGHLIECSAYVTGGNFAGFDRYPIEKFVDPGFPIAEVDCDGSCVITKHPNTGGLVTVDTCRSQLVYELQGNVYLNSDVKAYVDGVTLEQVGEDRVHVYGARGAPPPPTTKLAIFYKAGYEVQILINATGYAYKEKFELFSRQLHFFMGKELLEALDVFDLQSIGVPEADPKTQDGSTVYYRIIAQSSKVENLAKLGGVVRKISLKHFHGFHASNDMRTAVPRPYLAFYPALWPQQEIHEAVNFVDGSGSKYSVSPPRNTEPLEQRSSYDTSYPKSFDGPTRKVRLGDVALGRSGDKGGNLNFGLFVDGQDKWDWLRSYLTIEKVAELLQLEMREDFSIERVEFPKMHAVHFVVYGILGRGVSSSKRLDGFGKGFVDYFRDKLVDVPESLL
ncbi:DUF1446-domain-containing protein, partial [Aureobasidium melanogenum]